MNASNDDYYKELGVSEKASNDEIKKQFRKLSLQHHPDKGGDVNKFKKINEAYQILGDIHKREKYDNMRKFGSQKHFNSEMNGIPEEILKHMFNFQRGSQGASHFTRNNGFPFNFVQGSGSGPNVHIFRNGQNMHVNVLQKPQKIVHTLNISIEEAYIGCSKPIEIERWVKDDEETRRIEKETIYVDIIQGIDNNETIVLKDKGNVISDDIKGDVHVIIKVVNNTDIKREGLNLMYLKKITLKESLCGFSFTIKHLNNKEYKINNQNTVITPNYRKNVEGLGMKRGNRTGNLCIFFDVQFPETLTEAQINALNNIL